MKSISFPDNDFLEQCYRSVDTGPAVSACPWPLLEMHILDPHPQLAESQYLGNLFLTSSPGELYDVNFQNRKSRGAEL